MIGGWPQRSLWRACRALLLVLLIGLWAPLALARPEPVTVRVMLPSPFVDAMAGPVERFNQSRPDLNIAMVRGPLDTEAMSDLAISGLLLGDTSYDALLIDVSWLPKYVKAGFLEPLEKWLGDDALDGMVPGARLGNGFDGHLWRMPLTGDTGLLYWRTDLMELPPRTPEQLVSIARSLQRQGKVRWGYVWQGRQYEGLSCVVLETLQAFGANWWQNGTTDLGTAAAARAATWMNMLVRTGVTPPAVANFSEAETLQSFAAGDAAFLRNWPYVWRELETMKAPVLGRVGVTTVLGSPGQPGGGTLGTWGFSLLAGGAHPAETAEVIRWFTSPETQRDLTIRYGYAPTWQRLYDDPELARLHPLLKVQRQALENPVLRPPTPLYAQISDVMQRQVNGMLTGQGSGAQAMAAAQSLSEGVVRAASGRSGP